jgi:hypothetical protein
VVLASLVALAACDRPSPSAHPAATSRAQVQQVWRELVQCIREHGMPDLPDPTFDDQGHVSFPDDTPRVPEEAQRACSAISDRLPPNAQGGTQPPPPDVMQALVLFAQCMRAHGLPTWPDPDSVGAYPLPPEIIDGGNVKLTLQGAQSQCEQQVPAARGHVHFYDGRNRRGG